MRKKDYVLGSLCVVCRKENLSLNEISKTVPLGFGTKWLFWHEKNCKKDYQGAVEKVDVSYWDMIGYSKD